jgi:soluble lytic murein transglycosylase-like protein
MLFAARETMYLHMLAQAFAAQGLPPEWGPAFARTESNFEATAHSTAAGDVKRGGSFGLCQISYLTAKALGYTGLPQGLNDPQCNAELAAKLCKKNMTDYHVTSLLDVAALYNSGKRYAAAPASTKTVYVTKVVRFAAMYKVRLAQTPAPSIP